LGSSYVAKLFNAKSSLVGLGTKKKLKPKLKSQMGWNLELRFLICYQIILEYESRLARLVKKINRKKLEFKLGSQMGIKFKLKFLKHC